MGLITRFVILNLAHKSRHELATFEIATHANLPICQFY